MPRASANATNATNTASAASAASEPALAGPSDAEQLPAHGKKTRAVPFAPAALFAPRLPDANASASSPAPRRD
jgi:hypothetical protein